MRAMILGGILLVLAPVPAAALIQTVAFHGIGRVTYNHIGAEPEFPPPIAPVVGTPVTITGSLLIGPDAALPDNFTGNFQFDVGALFYREQGYRWTVAGGRSGASSGMVPYQGGSASFVAGRLTGIDLFVDYDGDIEVLGRNTWQAIYNRQDIDWGGTWALSVPEPSSWALMIAGFGLGGLRLRSRRIAA